MRPLTRNVILFVSLLVLAYLWRAEGIRSAVENTKLRERGVVLDSVSGVTDTLFADSLKRLQSKIVVAEGAVRSAGSEVNRLKGILGSLPPPPPSGPDTAVVFRDSLIIFQDSLISAQGREILFWKAVADAKDSVNLRLRQERDRYRDLGLAWQRQAHPGFLARVSRGVPYVLAGAALWEVVR